jgi:hypothetical protein
LGIEKFGRKRIFIVEIFVPNKGLDSNPVMGCPLRALWAGPIGDIDILLQ